ncbi:DNA translocase FtsK [Arcobacter roscoffensis]|uniref:DNA translocase FtsK 4TM domain-containing protein n=1 Tax=Arcobacter roscoffensis TaxID=2961520 RepID=A0ABY5E857_9BACT|nr:DNA translocase FtsK [Arcobacter roscoffensis]UTJ07911.1 DNA translocase FtsK 4TM domain-containing protein [Arcobacter roscoffensis]
MAKKIISLIVLFILVYFEYATFFSSKEIVGQFGSTFATYSLDYFGFLGYIYLFLFIYTLYVVNFKKDFDLKDFVVNISVVLLILFVSLTLQALLVEGEYSGKIGNILIDTLSPFIGRAGLFIFVIVGYVISFMVAFENSEVDFSKVKNLKNRLKLKESTNNAKKIENQRRTKRKEQKVRVTETGNVAEITLEKDLQQNESNEFAIKPDMYEVIEEVKDETLNLQTNTTFSNKHEEVIQDIDNNQELKEEIPEVQASPEQHSVIVDELEENRKLLDDIELGQTEKPKDFKLPPTKFFQKGPKDNKSKVSESVIDQKICDLLDKLSMFKIEGDVVRTYTGPVVTTFEFKPAPNVKVSKILNLQDDLAMALKAQTIRIQAPIPGKDVVGIEVPNEDSQIIFLREMLDSELFQNAKSPLTMILGKDIVGKPFVTDLKKLPHLLIAGTTGSGKSVGINSMILSLLYKNSPDTLKLVMIDPKMLEFSMYNDIPHLLTPVITKAGDAINALSNMVSEMERRYTLMSQTKTKNIENFNEKALKHGHDKMPYIVVVIDELADLMMTSGKDVEYSIARLAQMARAAGIHLIVATQRPSVDVVTGLIKANLPSRLSYKVGQKVDSKIILDSMGAESLLGRGDMLFTPPGTSGLVRIHAPWSKEEEIEEVVEFLKAQREVEYDMNFIKDSNSSSLGATSSDAELGDLDELYEDAKQVVLTDKKTSISYIQRKLRIGYNRAATIVEQLEQTGVLSEANTKGNREILV